MVPRVAIVIVILVVGALPGTRTYKMSFSGLPFCACLFSIKKKGCQVVLGMVIWCE